MAVSAECRAKSFPFCIHKSRLLALYHCVSEVTSALSVNFAPKFTCPRPNTPFHPHPPHTHPTPTPACGPHLSALPSPKPTHLTLNHFQILLHPFHSFNPRDLAHRWLHFGGGPIQNITPFYRQKKKRWTEECQILHFFFLFYSGRATRCSMWIGQLSDKVTWRKPVTPTGACTEQGFRMETCETASLRSESMEKTREE